MCWPLVVKRTLKHKRMAKITKQEFLDDVLLEIEKIKIHATQVEISRLKFNGFYPSSPSLCIYGLMTGRCDTARAKELMDLCCARELHLPDDYGTVALNGLTFDDAKKYINGAYSGRTWGENLGERFVRTYTYLSALEGYIVLEDAKNVQIFQYLNSEIDTLVL